MGNVSVEPDQLFLNVAAVNQQRGFLGDALAVELSAYQLLHAGPELFDISLLYGAAMFLDHLGSFLHVGHALP